MPECGVRRAWTDVRPPHREAAAVRAPVAGCQPSTRHQTWWVPLSSRVPRPRRTAAPARSAADGKRRPGRRRKQPRSRRPSRCDARLAAARIRLYRCVSGLSGWAVRSADRRVCRNRLAPARRLLDRLTHILAKQFQRRRRKSDTAHPRYPPRRWYAKSRAAQRPQQKLHAGAPCPNHPSGDSRRRCSAWCPSGPSPAETRSGAGRLTMGSVLPRTQCAFAPIARRLGRSRRCGDAVTRDDAAARPWPRPPWLTPPPALRPPGYSDSRHARRPHPRRDPRRPGYGRG